MSNERKARIKWWSLLVIILLGSNLLIRFVDESQLTQEFPLDFTNDISAYMAQLHFTKVCGFHEWCPYWYNGFVHLLMSPPGWYFFAYPLYILFGSVTVATFVSMILLYALGFIATMALGKVSKMNKIQSTVLFLIFFANASVVGNTIRNGRQHAMLASVLFVFLFALMWYYKERKINYRFGLASIIYSLMLVTHYQETFLAATFFASMFLYKHGLKEKMKVMTSFLASFILASWWLKGFIEGLKTSSLLSFQEGKRVFEFSKEVAMMNTMTIIIPLVFLGVMWWYYKKNKEKRELIFFIPMIVLGIFYLLKITTVIPILRNISQDPYLLFFLYFIAFILIKEENKLSVSDKAKKIIAYGFVAASIASVAISMFYTPFFEKSTPLDREITGLFGDVEGKFILAGQLQAEGYRASYSKPLYSYASIHHNLSAAGGWSPPLTNNEYLTRFDKLEKSFMEKEFDCNWYKNELLFFNVKEVITAGEGCERLEECGGKVIKRQEHACLYRMD